MIARTLKSSLVGAAVCAVLAAALFVVGAVVDGTRVGEAVAFSLVVAFVAAFIGALIGLVVGVANLGTMAGGLIGLLAAAAVITFYVLSNGRPGQYGYFLRASTIFLVVLALPTILAGAVTARLGRAPRQG